MVMVEMEEDWRVESEEWKYYACMRGGVVN